MSESFANFDGHRRPDNLDFIEMFAWVSCFTFTYQNQIPRFESSRVFNLKFRRSLRSVFRGCSLYLLSLFSLPHGSDTL